MRNSSLPRFKATKEELRVLADYWAKRYAQLELECDYLPGVDEALEIHSAEARRTEKKLAKLKRVLGVKAVESSIDAARRASEERLFQIERRAAW